MPERFLEHDVMNDSSSNNDVESLKSESEIKNAEFPIMIGTKRAAYDRSSSSSGAESDQGEQTGIRSINYIESNSKKPKVACIRSLARKGPPESSTHQEYVKNGSYILTTNNIQLRNTVCEDEGNSVSPSVAMDNVVGTSMSEDCRCLQDGRTGIGADYDSEEEGLLLQELRKGNQLLKSLANRVQIIESRLEALEDSCMRSSEKTKTPPRKHKDVPIEVRVSLSE